MKNVISLALCLVCALSLSSCLKMGLDELPSSDKAEVSNVKFEYRWWNQQAQQFAVVLLSVDAKVTGRTIACAITVPAASDKFPADIRDKVALSNLVCTTDISAGASIHPLDGAPTLGIPGDFSKKDHGYLVTAADGSEVEWHITITAFQK